ncbi:MAG TPA: ABC transporter permease [Mucilaginibacter sp.]|nr:ABC transporter permease [Mucilaginibacter sp.]
MVKSYLKTAIRFLLKNKTFSFINIFGLAAGTLCCLYILLYVQDQYSYDKHHKNAKDVYRITADLTITGDKHHVSTCSPPIAPAMKRDFAEVLDYTRVVPGFGVSKGLLRYKEKSIYEKDEVYVDSTFFNLFTYHFAVGTSANALTAPYSVVLLKSVADKLFGNEDPVNKVITIDNGNGKHDFKVTAVVDESLGKTHIKANIFVTMNSGGDGEAVRSMTMWAGSNFTNSYIKLGPDANIAAVEKKLPAFLNKYGAQQLKQLGMQKQLHLEPVTVIHTTPGYDYEISKTVSPSFLQILILIAVLIQVIACINFMNLSTARASKRAKEVGVRKVSGAGKYDLIQQFLGESFLLSFIGILIALPLLLLALPYLNYMTGTNIHLSFFNDYRFWLMLVSLVIITGFVAGSYPAFYLSAFKAVKVIKGNFTSHISAARIRRSLVIFQFVLSIVLITGIIVIYSQLNYIKNKDLGFDKDQKLIFSFYTSDSQSKMQSFANDLRQLADVKVVSKTNNYPSQPVYNDSGVYLAGGNMTTSVDAQNMLTDEYFVKASGIKIINGRDFTSGDSGKVLINETLAKRLGLKPETAPGTRLYSQYPPNPVTFVTVIGVMKDFNYNSLHDNITPFIIGYDSKAGDLSNLIVSVNSNNYKALIPDIANIWQRDLPSVPFEYAFLDDEVLHQYETEITMSRIINSFTLIAILISCLGLFGLASFSAEQRNKEIGIRKVLGASVSVIVQLLSKDFIKLVVVSFVIATPLAWYGMNKWLQAFAYRIPLSWWMFALAGLLAMLIALLTISFQTVKAAVANPVKSLRSE